MVRERDSIAGTFQSPAGKFSTLAQNTVTGLYTQTLPDGTQVEFNSAGQQTAVVDTNGNTDLFHLSTVPDN